MSNATLNLNQLSKVHRAWWMGAAALLLVVWGIGLAAACRYALQNEAVDLEQRSRRFEASLMDANTRIRGLMGDLMPAFVSGQLTADEVALLGNELAPWYSVTLIPDPSHLPAAFPASALAPGKDPHMARTVKDGEGRWRTFIVLRRPDGAALSLEANRDELLGPFLADRFARAGFGPRARFRLLSSQETSRWFASDDGPPGAPPGFPHLKEKPGAWEFVVPPRFLMGPGPQRHRPRAGGPDPGPPPMPPDMPFPGDKTFPGPGGPFADGPEGVPSVLVSVPKWPIMFGVFRTFALLLAAGGLLLVAFAFSLRTLQQRIQQELELARAKANFTAMVSHELKTPVTAIRMYAEMLRDGLITDPETSKEFTGTIASEAVRLQRLIENLLELGKVESGGLRLALGPEPLAEMLAEALARAQSGHAGPGVIKLLPVPGNLRVRADRDAAIQAIANLIHNGLKYGGNPAEVEVEALEAGDRVVVEVRDRGPGIPSDRRDSIFEPYVRLENEETRTSQGTGLGLALVKAYATALGGTIEVVARPGGGSVFRLSLLPIPQGEPHESQAADH